MCQNTDNKYPFLHDKLLRTALNGSFHLQHMILISRKCTIKNRSVVGFNTFFVVNFGRESETKWDLQTLFNDIVLFNSNSLSTFATEYDFAILVCTSFAPELNEYDFAILVCTIFPQSWMIYYWHDRLCFWNHYTDQQIR